MPRLGSLGSGGAKGFGFGAAVAALPLSQATTIYSGTSNVFPTGVTGAPDGNFYVGVGQSGTDYVMKFNGTTGAVIWQRSLSRGQGNSSVPKNCIAVDGSNNVYFTKRDGSGGSRRVALVKYNSSGVLQWQRQIYTSVFGESNTEPGSVSVSADGTLIALTMTYVSESPNPARYRGGTLLYNSSGTLQWQRYIRSTSLSSYIELNASMFDSSNNIYVSGFMQEAGGGLIAKYNSSGTLQWQNAWSAGKGFGLGMDSSNNIYISTGEDPNTGTNFNLLKINTSGTFIANADGANGGIPLMPNMAVDANGNTYGMRTEGNNPWETKVGSANSSLVTRFSNRVTVSAGAVNSAFYSYNSSLLGNTSTGLYFLSVCTYQQTAGGFGGTVFKFLRAGTDTGATTQTVSPITWNYVTTASAARSIGLTYGASSFGTGTGDATDAAGGQTDSASTLSSSTNYS